MAGYSHLETTSALCPSLNYGVLIVSIIFLVFIFPEYPVSAAFPLYAICLFGGHISFFNGLFLAVIYTMWISLFFFPVYLWVGWHFLIVLNFPLLVLLKKPSTKASRIHILLLNVLWDYPQLLWIYGVSFLGQRALTVGIF